MQTISIFNAMEFMVMYPTGYVWINGCFKWIRLYAYDSENAKLKRTENQEAVRISKMNKCYK